MVFEFLKRGPHSGFPRFGNLPGPAMEEKAEALVNAFETVLLSTGPGRVVQAFFELGLGLEECVADVDYAALLRGLGQTGLGLGGGGVGSGSGSRFPGSVFSGFWATSGLHGDYEVRS